MGFDSINTSSFSFLDELLSGVKIVGYGEDTHGTAEFTTVASSLMTYLAENHGFNIFVIETGFGEGQYLNDYIHGRRNDLSQILEKHNSTWRYKTKEFYLLMEILRKYNSEHIQKIHLYGCEMQYVVSDVNRIKDYLQIVGSDYIITGFEKHLWQPITEEEKVNYYVSYTKLKQYFRENYEAFVARTSEEAFQLTFQHIVVLGQFVTAINQNHEQRKHDFRDIYMGENIQWVLEFYGSVTKALYWAHNAHVGDWVSNGIVDVTGHQLRKLYGNAYFNIATDFGVGEFLAFSKDWKIETFRYNKIHENSFTQCLKNLGKPNTFLNLRKAKSIDKLNIFLQQPLTTMSGAGAQIRDSEVETTDMGKAFDGIIYLDITHKIHWAE